MFPSDPVVLGEILIFTPKFINPQSPSLSEDGAHHESDFHCRFFSVFSDVFMQNKNPNWLKIHVVAVATPSEVRTFLWFSFLSFWAQFFVVFREQIKQKNYICITQPVTLMLKASRCNYLLLVKSFYDQNALDRKDLLFMLIISFRAAGRFYEEPLLIKQACRRADKGELCEMSISQVPEYLLS